MTFVNSLLKSTFLASATIGSLLTGVSIASTAMAQTGNQSPATTDITLPSGGTVQLTQIRVASTPPYPQNPCPGIYYENPFNQYVLVPQVCRPNLITQQLNELGLAESIRSNYNSTGVGGSYPTPNTNY